MRDLHQINSNEREKPCGHFSHINAHESFINLSINPFVSHFHVPRHAPSQFRIKLIQATLNKAAFKA